MQAQILQKEPNSLIYKLFGIILFVLIAAMNASAQSGAGAIQGTITDSTGAVIPEASVHVVNNSTGVAVDTKSNNVGFYQVPGLFTGTYEISITAPGMATYNRTLQLLVGQNAVIDASLTAGAVTQQVSVTADMVQLTTTNSGTISSTLENSRINQLPMNGRSIISLVSQTTPGLESCSQSDACPNGLMGQAMEFVADGVSLTNREFGGVHSGTTQMPDPDAVQEARVETTGSSAQFATPATGVFTTKSGTNQLHGTLFETARNNYFGIARSRANPSDFKAPHYVRNEFGISVGGPIKIPGLYNGKDKSFWFFSYERYSLASFEYVNKTVPTAAMRQGDFSQLKKSNVLQQLYDPNTTASSSSCAGNGGTKNTYCRTPFANNQIPYNRISPTARVLLDITPMPTDSSVVNPLAHTNLVAKSPSNTIKPSITFRLDHAFNENNRAYLRYTSNTSTAESLRNDPSGSTITVAADGLPAGVSGVSLNTNALYAPAIGFTHIFSPTFYAETVVSQQWFMQQNNTGGEPTNQYEQTLGVPNNFGTAGLPYFNGLMSPLGGQQFLYGMTQIVSTIDENLTKTVGKHQFQFGGRYRHERFGSRPDMSKDTISFNGLATGLYDPSSGANYSKLSNTGYNDADAFLGAAYSYSVNKEPPYQHLHDMEYDAYFQDNYRVRRNLTLNIGLRYEAHPAIWSKYGMMSSFDLKNHAIVLATTPDQLVARGITTQAIIDNDRAIGVKFETAEQAGMPANTLTKNYLFTFGPRVGIAWLPFGDKGTVLRGAYGRFIYPEPIRNSLVSINRANPFNAGYTTSYTSADQSPDGLPNYLLRSKQSVVMGVNSAGVVNSSTGILPGLGSVSLDPDSPPTYVTQTNFTIEQPLKGNSVLRLSYLYTHASNLAQDYYYNNHPSTYTWEVVNGTTAPTGNVIGSNQYSATATGPYDQTVYGGGSYMQIKKGWSNDNIFQANYQRLFHQGLAYQISYSWSKPFRLGGNSNRDGDISPVQNFANSGLGTVSTYTSSFGSFPIAVPASAPPAPPAGSSSYAYYKELNRFENYIVDTDVPVQHIQFNGIVDLPFGRGKWLLGHVNRFVDELVGGYQIAGSGSIQSQSFTVTSTNWGPTSKLHVYKHKIKVNDCTSGSCYPEYLWFNGYIAPTAQAGNVCSAGLSTVISGLPSDYTPYQTPSDQGCSAPQVVKGVLQTVTDKYYGANEVNMTLANGKTVAVGYQPYPTSNTGVDSAGANPFSHTVLPGPFFWTADLSLFKVFPIGDKANLRLNVDAFNAFNVQGYNNPSGTTGLQSLTSSKNTPRQIQLTMRLTF